MHIRKCYLLHNMHFMQKDIHWRNGEETRRPIYLMNSVDKSKVFICVSLPNWRSITVSLETNPFPLKQITYDEVVLCLYLSFPPLRTFARKTSTIQIFFILWLQSDNELPMSEMEKNWGSPTSFSK